MSLALSARGRVLVSLAALAAAALPARAAEKRFISDTDLFRLVWIADPRIAPDGRQVAFVRVTVGAKKEGYETAIWMVPADGSEPARPFTSGPHDSAPRWSPDGRTLAFLRAPLKDGKPEPQQIHLIPARGGEARAVTDLPRGAGAPAWSPDGRALAFTSDTLPKDLAKKDQKDDERESDVRVITQTVYRSDGAGYLDPTRPGHVWVLELPEGVATGGAAAPAPRALTSGAFDEDGLAWSLDGARVFFASQRVKDASYTPPDTDIFSVPRAGGASRLEQSIDGPIGDYALEPGAGGRVAFVGYENPKAARSYDQQDLFVAGPGGAPAPANLTTAYDNDIDGAIIGDQRAPRGGLFTPLVWSHGTLLVKTAERGRGAISRFDLARKAFTPVTSGDQEVLGFSASADGGTLAVLVSTPTVVNDLLLLDAASGRTRVLYQPNAALFAELTITPPEEIEYTSFDGKKIQAWIQKPPNYVAGQRYPLILNIHGGPHAAYGWLFMHEFQWMAAKGYVVLYPNPRGSTTYGQEFGNVIQYHYPGDDFRDLMAGVDQLVKRGLADPDRLGITGGSGGGVLTNWAIAQTDRFKAAVSQRSISDWASWWYTADFTQFHQEWFRGAPFEAAEDFAARSPLTLVTRMKTPLMLIEGEADMRTPSTAGGEPLFRALKYRRIPTVMVKFPGESHNLSRSGQPWHRVERLQHITAWFDRYLLAKPSIEYDVE